MRWRARSPQVHRALLCKGCDYDKSSPASAKSTIPPRFTCRRRARARPLYPVTSSAHSGYCLASLASRLLARPEPDRTVDDSMERSGASEPPRPRRFGWSMRMRWWRRDDGDQPLGFARGGWSIGAFGPARNAGRGLARGRPFSRVIMRRFLRAGNSFARWRVHALDSKPTTTTTTTTPRARGPGRASCDFVKSHRTPRTKKPPPASPCRGRARARGALALVALGSTSRSRLSPSRQSQALPARCGRWAFLPLCASVCVCTNAQCLA